MIVFWTLLTVIPLAVFAAGAVAFRSKTLAVCERFFVSRPAAVVLTAIGWLWTAYECDTIGIDIFDAILLKSSTNGVFVWALAVLLIFLTCLWMPKHLPCRALMGLFMLMPAEALKVTRPLVPAPGAFAPVQLLVLLFYVYAVIGMFGMFYPWHIENAVRRLLGGTPVPTHQEK